MAKKQSTPKPKAPKRNPGATPAPLSLWQRYKNGELKAYFQSFMRADNVRFIVGVCTVGISLFLLISFVSNIFTGRIDQTSVQNGSLTHAANYGGKLGAIVSNYFMDTCFGLCSILIPIFLLMAGVKLMGAYRVRLWKWFLNFSIVMIWGSVFLALVTHVLPQKVINFFSFRLGGGHGDFIRDYLITNLGSLGAWIVVLATAVFYMMYLTNETINVVRKIMNPQDFIKEKLPKRHHNDADPDAEDAADADTADDVADNTARSTSRPKPQQHLPKPQQAKWQ